MRPGHKVPDVGRLKLNIEFLCREKALEAELDLVVQCLLAHRFNQPFLDELR